MARTASPSGFSTRRSAVLKLYEFKLSLRFAFFQALSHYLLLELSVHFANCGSGSFTSFLLSFGASLVDEISNRPFTSSVYKAVWFQPLSEPYLLQHPWNPHHAFYPAFP
jgi:hypothetical protein